MYDTITAEYEARICPDCVQGYFYDEWDTDERADRFAANWPGTITVDMSLDETGAPIAHFSHYPCSGCGERLSGDRYDARVLEWDN